MGKFYAYMMAIVGLIIILEIAGFPTTIGFITDAFIKNDLGEIIGFDFVSMLDDVAELLVIAIGAGILVGFISSSASEYTILSSFAAATLYLFVGTFVMIFSFAAGYDVWIRYIILIVFGTIGFGYIIALLDWVFNRGGS